MIQEVLIPLISLIALEIILGIDNLIFISILSDKLPPEKRSRLRSEEHTSELQSPC